MARTPSHPHIYIYAHHAKVEGKFFLTTYPSEELTRYTAENGWHTMDNIMHLSASNQAGKMKNEVFTMNYTLGAGEGLLF